MQINIVTNAMLLQKIKTVSYYKTDLGKKFRNKQGRNGPTRVTFEKPFEEAYFRSNGRLLMKSGTIGKINVYTDYGINQSSLHIYSDNELFEFDFNSNDFMKAGSMEKYLGALLKKIERDKKLKLPKVEIEVEKGEKKKVDPNKLFNTPGDVKWDDLQEYLKKKKGQ